MLEVIDCKSFEESLVYDIANHLRRVLKIDITEHIHIRFVNLNGNGELDRRVKGELHGQVQKVDKYTSGGYKSVFLIEIEKTLGLEDTISTIGHELYHVHQRLNNLDGIKDPKERDKEYNDRLFEIEARKFQRGLDYLSIMHYCYQRMSFRLHSSQLKNKDK